MGPSFIERIIEREIDQINDHLPQTTILLSQLESDRRLTYVTRGGDSSAFRADEIDFLLREVPPHFRDKISLPIVILRRIDLGPGMYTISGGRLVSFLLHRVLGQVDLAWEDLMDWTERTTLARPEVQAIRRRLPTTTCLGFAHSVPRRAFSKTD